MPQLDASSFPSQLFWLTISFVVLYLLLARISLPRVQSVLALRAHTLDDDITQALEMKTQAQELHVHYEKALADTRAKSQVMFNEAQAAIAVRTARQQAELDREIEKKLEASDASIRATKQGVMDKLLPVSGELAALIIEVLVHQKPDAKEIGAVVSELAKERAL